MSDALKYNFVVSNFRRALSYIDNHFDKKKYHPRPSKVRCYFSFSILTEGKSESHPIHFLI